MNLKDALNPLPSSVFRAWRSVATAVPGGTIRAFGPHDNQISAVVVINLDRQPERWRRIARELRRFKRSDGVRLLDVTRRISAIDARDGRAVAATADVDPHYRIGDQLYVQPDDRLAGAFSADEPVRMTRQEIAVARSHIEAWKGVANGNDEFTLILEDDAWIRPGARQAINRGWQETLSRLAPQVGPLIVFLSYEDAGGTAAREDIRRATFRPIRGLWHLSGYVLSRDGAATLLRAMPVVGPVDLWMNFRLNDLQAFALNSPAILQRKDAKSDNSYSVLPYLARAGVVDVVTPLLTRQRPRPARLLVWSAPAEYEGLAMAISMLGLTVRVFDRGDALLDEHGFSLVLDTFDAIVNPPLTPDLRRMLLADDSVRIVVEVGARDAPDVGGADSRSILIDPGGLKDPWGDLCALLGIDRPGEAFPRGAHMDVGLFRDRRPRSEVRHSDVPRRGLVSDESPWVLSGAGSARGLVASAPSPTARDLVIDEALTLQSRAFSPLAETFPGNRAGFSPECVQYSDAGAELVLKEQRVLGRSFSSGAMRSVRPFRYGCFRAQIRAARGGGVITGFFLHRSAPRQEIDIEFLGSEPRRMLTNVYFNPGDVGTEFDYGYRGTPHSVDLGFDSTAAFHDYAIEWRPDRIIWSVDGIVVHQRQSWDPTPIPHLDLSLNLNLWAPRSQELAGRLNHQALPTSAVFRNVLVTD